MEQAKADLEASKEESSKVPALEDALKERAASLSKLKMDVVNLERAAQMHNKQQEHQEKLKSSLKEKLNVSYLAVAQLKMERKEESKGKTIAEENADRLERETLKLKWNITDRDTDRENERKRISLKEEALEKLKVEMEEHLTQAKLIALSHAKSMQDRDRKITELDDWKRKESRCGINVARRTNEYNPSRNHCSCLEMAPIPNTTIRNPRQPVCVVVVQYQMQQHTQLIQRMNQSSFSFVKRVLE